MDDQLSWERFTRARDIMPVEEDRRFGGSGPVRVIKQSAASEPRKHIRAAAKKKPHAHQKGKGIALKS